MMGASCKNFLILVFACYSFRKSGVKMLHKCYLDSKLDFSRLSSSSSLSREIHMHFSRVQMIFVLFSVLPTLLIAFAKSCISKVSQDFKTFLRSLARLSRLSRLLKPERYTMNIVKPFSTWTQKAIFQKISYNFEPWVIFNAFLCIDFFQMSKFLCFLKKFPCQIHSKS